MEFFLMRERWERPCSLVSVHYEQMHGIGTHVEHA